MFIVVAIVIFGIFVVLANTLFGSEGLTKDLKGLFENSIEQASSNTVRNKSLVDIDDWKGFNFPNENPVEQIGEELILVNAGGKYTAGIYIDTEMLDENKEYALEFKIKTLDDTTTRVGGHLHLSTNTNVYLNGEYLPNTNFSTNYVPLVSSDQYHNVRVEFNAKNIHTVEDPKVYIQPMRGTPQAYKVSIKDITLKEI